MQFSRYWTKVVSFVLLLNICFLSACSSAPSPTVTTAIATQIVAAASPTLATATVIPTHTNTATPRPTATPTSSPTASTIPPSATPSPTPSHTTTPPATPTPRPSSTPLPQPTAQPALTIGEIPNHLGSEVSVTGQVVATASFAGGYKFTLSDGTGQVTLLMWSNVYDNCWDAPTLNLGATVTATGTVGQFEGEWQVEPDFGGDVRVAAAGTLPPVQAIGSLGDYMNQRVTIMGQISRVEGTSSGAKLFVTDESGEILVFIWNNTLNRITNNTVLGVPGTRVQVVGYVQEFRSNREIIPALPYDVTVLP